MVYASQLVEEALKVECDEFVKIVGKARSLLNNENGKFGKINIIGRLAKIEPSGEAIIVGDLHGDLESTIKILEESRFMEKAERENIILIFLGDYGDRGAYSAEVYYVILQLKLLFPKKVVLMRGNHEGPDDLLAYPHDLPIQFQNRFGEKWKTAYLEVRRLFSSLYNAVLVEKRYLMIHGGIPVKVENLEDLAYAHIKHPKERIFEDMLWSDPAETVGIHPSPRGAGKLFGKDVTEKALKKFDVKILIRGHEPCMEGFSLNHDGKILTLFSRKGSPYFNVHGAYLDVDLSKIFENAEQLIPYIHKF